LPETIVKHASKTAITLMVFALVFTALMAYIFTITQAPIAKSEAEARMSLFSQVMPTQLHDNNVLEDTITLAPDPLLGNQQPIVANLAKLNGKVTAIILEAVAHDGYSGDIKLLIAIQADGTVAGVRVIAHKETPGLGDYIEIAKNNWIKLFDQASLNTIAEADWKVKKDGGKFDYMVGATITPRAVVKAVHHALLYFKQHQQTILAT
jgi:Na+-translocating ferredoxin:NAD+ oxidoreductase subunit G